MKKLHVLSLPFIVLFLGLLVFTCCLKTTLSSVPDIKSVPNTILLQCNAALRITTPEGKVIYVDPWCGKSTDYDDLIHEKGFDLPADLILVTHSHWDHYQLNIIEKKNLDCQTILWKDMITEATEDSAKVVSRTYKTGLDLGFVIVDAIEGCHAGGASYALTLSNAKSIYISGDIDILKGGLSDDVISQLAGYNLDYAFINCDGENSIDAAKASDYAARIKPKHIIPYHIDHLGAGNLDIKIAEKLQAEGRVIMNPGETIAIE